MSMCVGACAHKRSKMESDSTVFPPVCILIVTSPVQLPIYPPLNDRSLYQAPKPKDCLTQL